MPPVMSGALRAMSFHLFLKKLPCGTASEQTDQLDQSRIGTFATPKKLRVKLDEPKRCLPLLTITSLHYRANESRLQVQWSYDWPELIQKQLESMVNI
jgi:hypothetical protein